MGRPTNQFTLREYSIYLYSIHAHSVKKNAFTLYHPCRNGNKTVQKKTSKKTCLSNSTNQRLFPTLTRSIGLGNTEIYEGVKKMRCPVIATEGTSSNALNRKSEDRHFVLCACRLEKFRLRLLREAECPCFPVSNVR